ncbi:NYN domain-containing protein [Cellulomonas fimi]|uniref:NYN domain-containing protein n=1 Tax=Cellulomonas fimi TaxID=1708 RepID=UPI00234C24C7|nr:NYN domain-containing protein [Cellulomonas fimi]MDC7121776.1 NYN domain-containing protein [Cellulomonas fimi]
MSGAGAPDEPVTPAGDARATDVPLDLRAALVQVAADVLGGLDAPEVPAALRAVRQFAPRRRASAGAGPLWAALQDDAFRARVARVWATEHPDLAHALAGDTGSVPEPGTRAAVGAWLLGHDWSALVATPDPRPSPEQVRLAERLARSEAEAARLRDELAVARSEAADARDALAALQRELRRLRSDADRARSEGRRHADEAAAALARADEARLAAEDDARAAADDLRAAQAERTAARAELRSARKLADARVRLLLDTIVDAASGLRHELALPPAADLPADLVAPDQTRPAPRSGSRGRSADDPALLDELLRQPWAHLLVDGYNVTKTGFGELTLVEQRRRLVDGLARVAAGTGAEVTCCFDGQPGQAPPSVSARGVRVLFSVGEIADDLIRRLVAAEPPGRVLVVVTSDQAVARDVEARGAWVVPSTTLLARLQHL